MTKEEENRLKQLDADCQEIKNREIPEQWKKPDNGPMLTLLAIKDFGPAVVPTLARLMQENIDLLRENNVVHREHMKSENKLIILTIALLILTFILAIFAAPPAIESFKKLWASERSINIQQTKKNTYQPTQTEQINNSTNHNKGVRVGKVNQSINH